MKIAALCVSACLLAPAAWAAEPGDGLREFLAGRAARDA
jgi:hypothetical protein